MTRSAEQAIDETQAKLGESCERLLASSAWNRAHTSTHKGLLKRLQMIPDAGLNRMRVVAHSTLRELGRIPRSHEGHQEDYGVSYSIGCFCPSVFLAYDTSF